MDARATRSIHLDVTGRAIWKNDHVAYDGGSGLVVGFAGSEVRVANNTGTKIDYQRLRLFRPNGLKVIVAEG